MKEENPILGQVISEEAEKLQSIKDQQAERRLKIMEELDAIKVPLLCTVIMEPQPFDYRNMAFWMALKEKDDSVKVLLTEYLNNGKKR